MAKKEKIKHFRVLVLTEDFGNNKAGDTLRVETTLAARLIDRNVAVLESKKADVIIEVKEVKVKQIKTKKK
jgi:mRNA-degrading endonuclease toxin of MazEF toxin-antitoxin module